jgi:hypothetical protein
MHRNGIGRYVAALAPITLLLLAAAAVLGFTQGSSTQSNDRVENSDQGIAFRNDMRKLWEDHVTWTRLAIISLADELPDQDASVGRLLQNQVDIGDAIKPYYGDAAGDQLTSLLHDHITIAAELVVAARDGDSAAAADANARWYANANDIAALLNSANPQAWPLEHMQQMMKEHLDLTLAEAVARLNADYPADVAAYDQIHVQILGMADMLSLGIINQFPREFR